MKKATFVNGDQIPLLGLGTWKSAEGEAYKAVYKAIRIGYRHIDCAYIYGNEKEVGDAIKDAIEQGLVSRQELWITSKLWNSFHGKGNVEKGIDESLKSLQLDYLDLYLIHWPVVTAPSKLLPESGADFISLDEVPLIETWTEMIKLQESGKARHIGVSNFSETKIEEIANLSGVQPEMNQIERHAYMQQGKLISYCKDKGIHITCYSPLGSPDRPARVRQENEPALLQNEKLLALASKNQISPAQTLIAWTLAKDLVVIPKSANVDRLLQNFEAAEIVLSEEDIKVLDGLEMGHRYINGSLWAQEGSPYTIESLWS